MKCSHIRLKGKKEEHALFLNLWVHKKTLEGMSVAVAAFHGPLSSPQPCGYGGSDGFPRLYSSNPST